MNIEPQFALPLPLRSLARGVPWAAFLAQRERRRQQALAAAAALAAGQPSFALSMLEPWRFARYPALSAAILASLRASPPAPPDRHRAALLAPADALRCRPPSPESAAEHLHQGHLFDRAEGPSDPWDPVAWGLAALAWTGGQVALRERQAWERAGAPHAKDAAAADMWRRFLGGDFWGARAPFEALFGESARHAFRAALACHRVPVPERRSYLQELEETLFWYMVGGSKEAPGWQEVAVRLLEQRAVGPIDGLAASLGGEGWRWAVGCPLAKSPTWQDVAASVWPDLPGLRAWRRAFLQEASLDPGWLEAGLDARVALRLLRRWQEDSARTHPADDWHVVVRHRSQVRGRLRAVVLETAPDALAAAVADAAGLFARTAQAVRVYAWCRACGVLQRRQLPGWEDRLTPPCAAPAPETQRSPEHDALIRAWLLLAVLRGRLPHVRHWARTGQWLQRPDGTFGRLLEQVPPALRDAAGGYGDLQAELGINLAAHEQAARPALQALADAAASGALKRDFAAILARYWHDALPAPERFQAPFAARVHEALEMEEE